MGGDHVTLLLCGDVMLGRGVDQILPHPGDPELRESYIRDARDYVILAEEENGDVPRPAGFGWPWGDALAVMDEAAPAVRILNLETGVTSSSDFAPGKSVHYRMNPGNLPCLAAARPDVCALANNHVLDFGRRGLAETLDVLDAAELPRAGAGRDLDEALRPASAAVEGGGRVLVFSLGSLSSGVPETWAATADRSGVAYMADPDEADAAEVLERVRRVKRPGDIVVVSVHWGSNWGYDVPPRQTRFAHALLDGGADVVHGHSSHHPRPVEVHHGKLVLYGCGDLVNDYEGIPGYEAYRDDLRLLYRASIRRDTGALAELRMTPLRARRLRLWRASAEEAGWLRGVLDRASSGFGTRIGLEPGGPLTLSLA
ncbi:CapA family protein [Actinomadura viridis]|uniref:CapA family protein n=1 Tax=Actinomadura viridis TaxID=58110 RepID=UPI00368AD14C